MTTNQHDQPAQMVSARFLLRNPADADLQSEITENRLHYNLCHMGIPVLQRDQWALDVCGLVRKPRRFQFADVAAYPKLARGVTLECAGNPLNLDQPIRRVSTAVWGGCRLRDLVASCEPLPEARYIWFEGYDHGTYADVESSEYLKYIALERIHRTDCLLAYEMNGVPLPAEHGFPLRVVVPGCYGTNSVKWVKRIGLSRHPPSHWFSTYLYTLKAEHGLRVPIWDIRVNSRIVSPASGSVIPVAPVTVKGWAWSAHPITRVEVSIDAGTTWADAALQPGKEDQWTAFSAAWTPRSPGRWAVVSRAHDAAGNCQPAELSINQATKKWVTVSDDL